jgi:hypothetical protein
MLKDRPNTIKLPPLIQDQTPPFDLTNKTKAKNKMCQGLVTGMSCGHALIHYTWYCYHPAAQRDLRPYPRERVHGPVQHIDDTCAQCHPPIRMKEINARYDEFRDGKMAQLRRAQTKEEVLILQRVIQEAHAARAKELRDAGRVRWTGVMLWGPPGAGGHVREECE